MIDRRVVCAKLSQLRERQAHLDRLAAEPREAFLADPIKIGAAERLLQVSIEICLDIGHHLIAAQSLPRPREYRDVFRILGEHGRIPAALAERLEGMAGFRNRLVHLYADVDPARVYEFLQKERSDLMEFAAAVAASIRDS
ncbi:MAG: DUF86 domain-containing protein [Deltaproteobacteria bacterium]|nr:DUF86 domain-containing protein [Deltaproteobacteria bacterium]